MSTYTLPCCPTLVLQDEEPFITLHFFYPNGMSASMTCLT